MSDLLDRIASVLTPDERARLTTVKPIEVPTNPTPGVRLLAKSLRHEYATFPATDELHRGILLQHAGGAFGLHKMATGELDQMLPSQINHSAQPRWRRTQPDKLIFRFQNQLQEFDAGTGAITTIRKFAEYADINNGIGESDLSPDDRHIALFGGLVCFVYDFVADKVEYKFNLTPGTFNNFYITSTNEVIVGYNQYHMLHRKDGSTLLLAQGLGHMDTSSDKAGNPVMVWCASADSSGVDKWPKLGLAAANGAVHIDVNTGKQTLLHSFKENWPAMHISLPDKADSVMVSTHNYNAGPPHIEVLKVGFDGKVGMLASHTAAAKLTSSEQPLASISHDGTRFVFNSGGDTWMGTL